MDILDNVVPYISGEEEKMEQKEPQKAPGRASTASGIRYADYRRSAPTATALPTRNGHLEAVSVEFAVNARRRSADPERYGSRTITRWRSSLNLPSAPQPAIHLRRPRRPPAAPPRPAGRQRAWHGHRRGPPAPGPASSTYKFMALGHNTIRGAAGGSLLNAELLVAQGYIG
jgi:aspartate-semialdehyde dehydrogenase